MADTSLDIFFPLRSPLEFSGGLDNVGKACSSVNVPGAVVYVTVRLYVRHTYRHAYIHTNYPRALHIKR